MKHRRGWDTPLGTWKRFARDFPISFKEFSRFFEERLCSSNSDSIIALGAYSATAALHGQINKVRLCRGAIARSAGGWRLCGARLAVPPARAHRKHVRRDRAVMYIEPAAFRASSDESLARDHTPAPVWTQCLPSPLFAGKKAPLKTYEEVQPLLQQGRKRDLKLVIRENSWPINSPVRAALWPALCRQHQHGKSMLDGFYWDMVTQVACIAQLVRIDYSK
ncbi:hypothetical protein RR46_03692 [Papilio xuthus]|uniref:Uncharacterized protein n=1 Tax=Papilio xuthus TaxID=66420 RepID=A0A194Q553_PAPXU|nr:hypothetical protein RR46_03692 [Papilio xuthus]